MVIFGGSVSGKTNALLNLTKEQDSGNFIDKVYLYAKGLSEPIYHILIKKREDAGIKLLNDPKAFIEYLNSVKKTFSINRCIEVFYFNTSCIIFTERSSIILISK